MGKRVISEEERRRRVLYQQAYRARKSQDESWLQKERARTRSYYKAKKDKTAMELAAYNKIQKEKMQKIRSAKKTARQLAAQAAAGSRSGTRQSTRLKKKSIPQNQAAQPDITDSQESDVDPQPGPSGYNPQPGPSGVKQVAPGSSRVCNETTASEEPITKRGTTRMTTRGQMFMFMLSSDDE